MTYLEAEQYILSLASVEQTNTDYTKNLKRIEFFLKILGNPEKNIPEYIHVTGTSGKGSVCAFLQSILTAGGKKTGLLCSPHPTILLERWKIGQSHMKKSEFVEIVAHLKPYIDTYAKTSPYDMITFFDVTTIIGLYYFAQKKVDTAVIEVGVGGRFDSTNIIPHKKIAVITNIGLDHTELLGDTKEKIAFEKSGIIKKNCQVFSMERDEKILKIIKDECGKVKTQLHVINPPGFKFIQTQKGISFEYQQDQYHIKALGKHQIHNAILCLEIGNELGIETKKIQKGLKSAQQPLRMEIVSQKPLIIFDGAHNEDKIKTTVQTIQSLRVKNIHLLLGFSYGKDIQKMIEHIAQLKPKTIACTRNTMNPFRKVVSPIEIQKLFKKHSKNTKTKIFFDPKDAFHWSQKQQKKTDLLVVTGSIFLSGEIKVFFHQS